MKYQTVVHACGMDMDVYGPESVRHNDSFTLDDSDIELRWEDVQTGEVRLFQIFGDSAYVDGRVMRTGGGRGMASVRESIEWTYKDLKGHFFLSSYLSSS